MAYTEVSDPLGRLAKPTRCRYCGELDYGSHWRFDDKCPMYKWQRIFEKTLEAFEKDYLEKNPYPKQLED